MIYERTTDGIFLERPNRFVALTMVNGNVEKVHVKNTGRCAELLLPGAEVVLQRAENPERKTALDLISVRKEGLGWVNIDSMAPNALVLEWLRAGNTVFPGVTCLKPEYPWGNSRIDFCLEQGQRRTLIEVKGCTLERNGVGYFPDAPTERGVKHLRELAAAAKQGIGAVIAFVIAMPGVTEVRPNMETHPAFGYALEEARQNGVRILYLPCDTEKDRISIREDRITLLSMQL